MIKRSVFSGFGGQGVLLMGYVCCHGGMLKGLNVTFFPSYGAEMRGGTANCTITLSDKKIASPIGSRPDILVAMNLPSLDKFERSVIPRGLILVNSSLVNQKPERSDVETIMVPTSELAKEAGSERAVNMVMMGVFCAKTGLLGVDDCIKGMEATLKGKEKFFELNRKGIQRGFEYARELK
jgi:2-oxoglutarate ferredoxin oxidoreductase subunit gamma